MAGELLLLPPFSAAESAGSDNRVTSSGRYILLFVCFCFCFWVLIIHNIHGPTRGSAVKLTAARAIGDKFDLATWETRVMTLMNGDGAASIIQCSILQKLEGGYRRTVRDDDDDDDRC